MFKFLVILGLLTVGCGKKGKKMAYVAAKMTNSHTALTSEDGLGLMDTTYVAPSKFEIKIVAVELVSTEGKYVAVWVNPSCAPEKWKVDLEERDELGRKKEAEYYNAENCSLSGITNFVDLAKGSAAVTAQLNSQRYPVPPGTYTSVSIRMCKLGDSDADKAGSIKFSADGMDSEHSFANASCGVTGAPVSPIAISDGATAKIDMQYNSAVLITRNDLNGQEVPAASRGAECHYLSGYTAMYCGKFGATTFVPRLVAE